MRVLIDATSLLLRSAGIKNYTYYWLRSLRAAAAPQDEIHAFPFVDRPGPLTHERSLLNPAETYARLALLYFVNWKGTRAIDWVAKRADVFHCTNQIRSTPRRTPVTATLYDFTCWLMPELHTPANVRAEKSYAARIVSQARRLIAISANTRDDAVRVMGLDPARIEVIYPGVPDEYFDATPWYRPKPYFLSLGAIEPRKNIDTLLDAWHLLKPDVRQQYDLVIAGASGWASGRTLERLRSTLPDVNYLGYVPEKDLPGLTAGATALVYPSLYEGFGFPVAQAMACRVPVITSNTSCLPEIAGDGALLVDPKSACEVASAIEQLATSTGLRERLGRAGAARADRYRWSVCARRSWDFFHSVA